MRFILIILVITVYGCHSKTDVTAQQVVDNAIKVSGGELFEAKKVTFKFRDYQYTSSKSKKGFKLTRSRIQGNDTLLDIKNGKDFTRSINNSLVPLADSTAQNFANSINSVHYFAKLPYGLNDEAVNKELLADETLFEKEYYKVKVTFNQQNGGEDFEDVYLYWIGKNDFKIDFLAYSFTVNGGGYRFRKAYNERFVKAIRFVDYENYAPINSNIHLDEIGRLFEAGKLKLLSKIELENVKVE